MNEKERLCVLFAGTLPLTERQFCLELFFFYLRLLCQHHVFIVIFIT